VLAAPRHPLVTAVSTDYSKTSARVLERQGHSPSLCAITASVAPFRCLRRNGAGSVCDAAAVAMGTVRRALSIVRGT
jgi:hypothetical protein